MALEKSITATQKISQTVLRFDCTLPQIAELTGLSLGTIKHMLYDATAPRYDRVIRLLVGLYLPEAALLEARWRCQDLPGQLIELCVEPLRRAASTYVQLGKKPTTMSSRRLKYIAEGEAPSLDSVVRLILGGIITPADLVPPLYRMDSEGTPVSLLPAGLTEENTRTFFRALRELFDD